jgi:hypothetical protein
MGIRHWIGDFSQLQKELRELSSRRSEEEERASYELAVSAREFSRRAKDVVDDKLSFSATLMRAGEVDAANRLLEEVEQDVRTEEAALIETMNEVKVARASKNGYHLSRKRLARMVGVSMAGAMLMGFSALGMAAASFLQDREDAQARQNAIAQRRALHHSANGAGENRNLKDVNGRVRKLLAKSGVDINLSHAELVAFHRLTTGSVNVAALQNFLTQVLPSPDLARRVASEIAASVNPVVVAVHDAGKDAVEEVETLAPPKVKRKAEQAEAQASASEPSAEPSDSPSEESEPEETAQGEGKKNEAGSGDGGNNHNTSGGGNDDDGVFPDGLPLDQ